MEFLADLLFEGGMELLFDLLFEGGMEVAKNRKITKWIRYPVAAVLLLFLIGVIGFMGVAGIALLLSKESKMIFCGVVLIVIDSFLILSGTKKVRNHLRERQS